MSWQIDQAHSQINFAVRHMMISKVKGEFTEFDGTIQFDPDAPQNSEVDITIAAASINTRVTDRDNHLRSPDFLAADEHPQLRFVSKQIEQADPHNGKLIGDLTIRNITHEVALDVVYAGMAKSPWGGTSAGFSAVAEIDRKAWGLTWNQALETGGILVGDTIKIEIELELVKQQ